MPRSIHTDEYRALTAILTQARRTTGLTQQTVANRLGKPQSYVAKIERAERRIDIVEFINFAKAMDIEPKALFSTLLVAIDASEKS